MSVEEASAFDPIRLGRALDGINRARRRSVDDPRRLRDLLSGFEALLEAETGSAADRDLAGGRALEELDGLLRGSGPEAGTAAVRAYLEPIVDRLVEALLDFPERRLAAYGSLQPGEPNHELVASLVGAWTPGTVRGMLHDRGWGAREGFPALVWDPQGEAVPVQIFESRALPAHWERLDAFEGPGYRRILAPVETGGALRVCHLYELSDGA